MNIGRVDSILTDLSNALLNFSWLSDCRIVLLSSYVYMLVGSFDRVIYDTMQYLKPINLKVDVMPHFKAVFWIINHTFIVRIELRWPILLRSTRQCLSYVDFAGELNFKLFLRSSVLRPLFEFPRVWLLVLDLLYEWLITSLRGIGLRLCCGLLLEPTIAPPRLTLYKSLPPLTLPENTLNLFSSLGLLVADTFALMFKSL